MKLQALEMYHDLDSNNTTEKKYYLIYCRKSSESEDRQIQSIDDQLQIAREIQERENLEVLEVFSESKSSGHAGFRPEYNRMIELIYSRKDIKGIICWKTNRLHRNPKEEGEVRNLLWERIIDEIITPRTTYTYYDSDHKMASEGAQGQRFILDLREDTARGVNKKLKRGMAPILAPPGYRNAIEKKQGERDIVPHPVYFPLLKHIFELFLTSNYSVMALHSKVEELKIKNSRNQIISLTQLYKILQDPFYTGTRFVYGKKLYTNGNHQAMITDEQYDLIQGIFSKRQRQPAQRSEGFLNGIMTCGECRRGITQETHRKKYKNGTTGEFIYYRCSKRKTICKQPYIPAVELEKQALAYLQSVKLSPRFVEWSIKWLNVMHQQQKEIKEARLTATQQEYNATVNKITKVVDLMIDGILTTEEGQKRKQQLEAEKARLFSILSQIDTHVTEWTNLTIQTFDFVTTCQDKFENGTIEQKKTILKVIGSNLIVKDRKLYMEMRTPFEYIRTAVAEISKNKANYPTISAQEAFLGSNQDHWGGLPQVIRTFFSSLSLREQEFYRGAYQYLKV